MLVPFDPARLTDFPTLDALRLLNRKLEDIRFTGRCFHIGWIVAYHPRRGARARVKVDGGGAYAIRGLAPPFDYEKERVLQQRTRRLRRIVSHAAKSALNQLFADGYRPYLSADVETDWDWALPLTIEDVVAQRISDAETFCVGSPLSSSGHKKSAMLYALLDTPLSGNLPDVMRLAPLRSSADYRWMTRNHTSFQQAVVVSFLADVLRTYLSDPAWHPTGGTVAVSGQFVGNVASRLMSDHVEEVSWWDYSQRTEGLRTRDSNHPRLFAWCSALANQQHEGRPLLGRICISRGDDVSKTFDLLKPVKTHQSRAIGKLIMASAPDSYPIVRFDEVASFGCYSVDATAASEKIRHGSLIEFRGPGTFRWLYRGQIVMDVVNGSPCVFMGVRETSFAAHFRRCFQSENYGETWAIVQRVAAAKHGAMVIISAEAESEAARIPDGFATLPCSARDASIEALASIDGGLLVSPDGRVFAFGFFLDGIAAAGVGDVSRGSRFNSAAKYAYSFYHGRRNAIGLLIVVVSQDGMVNLVPAVDGPQYDTFS